MPKIAITSGEFRGRKISTPDTSLVHPMGSREKLALFNTLESLHGPLTSETNVLDCFCGSGALGLEAISRGAGSVIFVDQNTDAIATTKQNLASLEVNANAKIIKSSFKNLNQQQNLPEFDVILADPPYDDYPENLDLLETILKVEGVLVLSHPTSVNPAEILPNLELIRTKKYAAANLSFFVKHSL